MGKHTELTKDINVNEQFKMLTRSYQEQAIGQINFARYSVLSSRQFATELDEIFFNVKTSYKNSLLKKSRLKGGSQEQNKTQIGLPNIKKGKKEVFVLITANTKLYGDIILKTCQLFAERAKESEADLIIIGKRGKDYIVEHGIKKQYTYFQVPDTNITIDLLKQITTALLAYDKVRVFYGKFNNIVSQVPAEGYLTGYLPDNEQGKKDRENFLFEPSIEEILIFFESQIFSILLNQTMQEGQLARFASRIKAMEQAQINIQKQFERLSRLEKRLKNMEMNKKQLEILAGRSLWGKT